MILAEPMKFAEAIESRKIKGKLPTNLSSFDLQKLSVEIRERCLFSAKTENAYYLQKIDDVLSEVLDAQIDPASARLKLKLGLDAISYQPDLDKKGSIQDLSSDLRLNLVLKTNIEMAQGYGQWVQGQDPDILDEFPAQEFIRVESRLAERQDWPRRWTEAGGKFFEGRMIALKNSKVWINLSRFGLPYPPFDFNSGMGLIDVDRSEAVAFRLISQNQKLSPEKRPFNEGLESSVTSFSKALQEALKADSKLVIDQGVLRIRNRVAPLLEKLQNAGNSSGAIKGWASRRKTTFLADAIKAPSRITSKEADSILTKGIEVMDAKGNKIKFGKRVKNYFSSKPEGETRKAYLNWAIETVKHSTPFKKQDRSIYVKVFEEAGKNKGFIVLTAVNGEVFNFYRKQGFLKTGIVNKSATRGVTPCSLPTVESTPTPSKRHSKDSSDFILGQVLKGDQ